jgi:magnesium-transporting ATPase (P-type)
MDLVIGDIILLRTNERCPADVRLIEAKDLKIDKSIIPDKSEPIRATISSQIKID